MSHCNYLGHIVGNGEVRPDMAKIGGCGKLPSAPHKEEGMSVPRANGLLSEVHTGICR